MPFRAVAVVCAFTAFASATQAGGGYIAIAVTPAFVDISATGTPVLQNTDDSVFFLGPTDLGGFTFNFYGQTYYSLYFSTNALITFGSANSEFANTDLTTDSSQATIAPLWADYMTFLNASGAVYWQVLGTGSTQQLVLEWKDVTNYFQSQPLLTFEAVLNADGSIQFNYQEVNNAIKGTAGIKDSGDQGADRLLLAFDSGPNQFVDNNLSTLLTPQAVAATVPEPSSIALFSTCCAGALGAIWCRRRRRWRAEPGWCSDF
jgi:hypothetical protein